jgi:hypothetical protein
VLALDAVIVEVKKWSAAISLALVVSGWLLLAWGVFRQLGDPNPMTPRAELVAARNVSLAFMFTGVATLAASVWLSGRAFEKAPIRSVLSLLIFVVPLLGLFACAFMARF